ncbi:AAA family ATPase [Hydrogenophaga sp. ANAO-22]|uniref:AAA family ATPase n=1 Tax=Hydrogenophaga sp. ANAO-22 TaxID=3166645 RepID=UPI0036D2DC55
MVAANKGRSKGGFPSKALCVNEFAHPLLRIAARVDDTPKTFHAFHRLVRRALDAPDFTQERADLAVEVLETLGDLLLDNESAEAFRLEWLTTVSRTVDSATLHEARAMAEIAHAGLTLPWGVWQARLPLSEGVSFIRLIRADAKVEESDRPLQLPAKAASSLISCVDSALNAHRDAFLQTWPARDCLATLRAIALLSVLESQYQALRQAESRKEYFLGVGQGLWTVVAKRLEALPEAEDHECFWDGSLQRLVALHVSGRAFVDASAPDSPPSASNDPQMVAPASADAGLLQVVHGPIPPSASREDAQTLRMFYPLLVPQPIAAMLAPSEVEAVLMALSQEFPWATNVVDELGSMMRARSLFGVRELCLSPVVIVGHSGAGKTRFVRRLAETLNLPYLPMALGGHTDSRLLTGTTRGWAGGEPTPLLRHMLQHRTASGMVLLDEIDKVGTSNLTSAPATSVLLGMLEPETASRWYDTFLQTTCDFSRLSFWATANSLKSLPAPLLSRFTVLYMPEPRPEDMVALVQGITDDIAREWRMPLGVLPLAPRSMYEGARLNARELRRLILRFLSEWADENRRPTRLH